MLILAIASCSYRPVLAPNTKFTSVGNEKANQDVDLCIADADEYLRQYKMQKIAKESARKAAIGAGVGAISGVLSKGNLKSTLTGGLVGAGVGAIIGAAMSAGEDKITPDQMKQKYVNQCLANEGYSVLGWQ